jgi:demethylmenaquinone methyltransferase / 2-methoxy-6-polyprenyl-1,4-benzoquinol methylase
MFAHIVSRYEWFDHVASLGNDLFWRPEAMGALRRFRTSPVERALDIGCGTGEFARQVARRFPRAEVVGVDFTREMVVRARDLSLGGPRSTRLAFASANGRRLPFADGAFDLVTNAFLLRSLLDPGEAFREMRRVLRTGGSLVTLDITEPRSPTLGRWFHAWFDHAVPLLGRAVRSEGPYRYLPESLRTLPPREEILSILRSSGFPRAEARLHSFGIVTTFLGEAGPVADQSR